MPKQGPPKEGYSKGKIILKLAAKPLLIRLFEIILGGLFFYAGLQKYLHPYEFAEAVLAYRLLPESLVGMTAAVLPWLEIAAGLCLVAGLKRRSGLLLLGGLVAGFLVVILITMARGLKIDCGCGLFFQRQVGLAAVLEDAVLLAWAAGLYWWELLRSGKCGQGSMVKAAP
jgi:putative oxidoreductase